MIDNFKEFVAETRALRKAPERITRAVVAAGVQAGGTGLVSRSPVKTGAYRSFHRLATGASRPIRPIYELSGLPDPANIPPFTGQVIFNQRPSPDEAARAAIKERDIYQNFWWFNSIPYSLIVEFQLRHLVYEQAVRDAISAMDKEANANRDLERPSISSQRVAA